MFACGQIVQASNVDVQKSPRCCKEKVGGRGRPPHNHLPYFFVALPSMAVIQLVPSCDSSYFTVYDVGESTFMV